MGDLRAGHPGRVGTAGGGRLSRPRPALLAAATACFLLVVLLGWAVQHGLTRGVDEAGLRALGAGDAAPLWRGTSRLGDSAVRLAITTAALLVLVWRRRRGDALFLAVLVLGGLALNGLAKQVGSRPRPGLLPHLEQVEGFSFPSGHSAGMAVLALGLALWLAPAGRRGPALLLATGVLLLVGLSRIALAVHWPSDVLAGWIEGVGWVLLVRAFAGGRHG